MKSPLMMVIFHSITIERQENIVTTLQAIAGRSSSATRCSWNTERRSGSGVLCMRCPVDVCSPQQAGAWHNGAAACAIRAPDSLRSVPKGPAARCARRRTRAWLEGGPPAGTTAAACPCLCATHRCSTHLPSTWLAQDALLETWGSEPDDWGVEEFTDSQLIDILYEVCAPQLQEPLA